VNRRAALRRLCAGCALSTAHGSARQSRGDASKTVELEIIVSSLNDAIAAYEGGASRFEVAVRLDQGGLTPPLSMVEQILQRVPIPARIMLRDNSGLTLTGPDELAKLSTEARALAKLPIDGLIVGFIRNGQLDLTVLRHLAGAAPSLRFTVHNAIEATTDPLAALRSLRRLPSVDGALVTGGSGSLSERIARLPAYEEALGPDRRLTLGGLHLQDLSVARWSTDIRTFHLGVGVRKSESPLGEVDIEKVKEARRLLSLPKA
jgi:copper homeostasis protein